MGSISVGLYHSSINSFLDIMEAYHGGIKPGFEMVKKIDNLQSFEPTDYTDRAKAVINAMKYYDPDSSTLYYGSFNESENVPYYEKFAFTEENDEVFWASTIALGLYLPDDMYVESVRYDPDRNKLHDTSKNLV